MEGFFYLFPIFYVICGVGYASLESGALRFAAECCANANTPY